MACHSKTSKYVVEGNLLENLVCSPSSELETSNNTGRRFVIIALICVIAGPESQKSAQAIERDWSLIPGELILALMNCLT